MHKPEPVQENNTQKNLLDFSNAKGSLNPGQITRPIFN